MTSKFLLLLIYAIISSVGLVVLKKGLNSIQSLMSIFTSPLVLIGIAMYSISFLIWLKIVKTQDLSYAFPIATAGTFILISTFSCLIYHENVSVLKIFGMFTILAGIVITANA